MNSLLSLPGLVLLSVVSGTVQAELNTGPFPYRWIDGVSPVPVKEGAGLRDAAELEAFIDGIMAAQLRAQHIAGATVAVLKDGKPFFAKGYGLADVANGIAVEADKTLFRTGSVSKVFTWTALMQLVEQGKVDLDADVNRYVSQFQIPDTWPGIPVTPRNLLTHTPGMEVGGVGYLIVDERERLQPLAEVLDAHRMARVRPPTTDFSSDKNASYSNWGASLAGLIVADVSGMSYDDYVEKNIFEPLGMTRSTFRQPVPAKLAGSMSRGYLYEAGRYREKGFEYVNFYPAGSQSATATDMARIMAAFLNGGSVDGSRILSKDSVDLMLGRMMGGGSPYINGTGLGLFERHYNGRRLLVHSGDTQWFHSDMNLLPDENVGLFISINSLPTLAFSPRIDLIKAFMDHYYPARLPAIEPPADFSQRAHRYTGSYRVNRYSHTKNEKLFSVLGAVSVTATDNDTLQMSFGPFNIQYVEVAPNVFRAMDDDKMIAFSENGDGDVDYIHNLYEVGYHGAYKLAWWETPAMLGLGMAFALISFAVAIVSAARHWRSDRGASAGARRARRLAGGVAVIDVAFVALYGAGLAVLFGNSFAPMPAVLYVALALPLLALPLTLGLWVMTGAAWVNGYWSRYGRVQYTLIAAGSTLFLLVLNYSNLIGYRFG